MRTLEKSLLSALSLALLGVLSTGCSKSVPEPLDLVPEEANVFGSVDLQALVKNKVFDQSKKAAGGNADDFLKKASECGVGPEKWERVTVGTRFGGENDPMLLVFQAEGLGTLPVLTCLQQKLDEGEKEPSPMEIKVEDGHLVLKDKETTGWAPSDDMLVVVSNDWASKVQACESGEGVSVKKNAKALHAWAQTDRHVWLVADLEATGKTEKTPAEDFSALRADADLGSGLALAIAAKVKGGPENVEKNREMFQGLIDSVKQGGAEWGISQATLDSLKIQAEGDTLTLAAKLSDDEIEKVKMPEPKLAPEKPTRKAAKRPAKRPAKRGKRR